MPRNNYYNHSESEVINEPKLLNKIENLVREMYYAYNIDIKIDTYDNFITIRAKKVLSNPSEYFQNINSTTDLNNLYHHLLTIRNILHAIEDNRR